MSVLYLTEEDVRQVLTMDMAIPAVEAAFRKIALDEAVNIPRQRCQTDQVMLHVMPAAAKTLGVLGFKAYTSTHTGAQFYVTLYDSKTGAMTALLQADYLGQVRTGAASAAATKKLAREESDSLGLLGTGRQAKTQLLGVSKVRKLRRIKVYSRDEANRKAFVSEMSPLCGVAIEPVATAEEAVREMDIVATATKSRSPILNGAWLADGAHVNIAGSNFLAKSETDVDVYRRAALITVDNKDQARLEAGDFQAALRDGILHWNDVKEFSQVLVGRYAGRSAPEEITLFKSLGLGIEDIAVAAKVFEAAKAKGLGSELPI